MIAELFVFKSERCGACLEVAKIRIYYKERRNLLLSLSKDLLKMFNPRPPILYHSSIRLQQKWSYQLSLNTNK